ncbi:MAG: hypothetical protein JXR16_01195 [Bermanella sp.]
MKITQMHNTNLFLCQLRSKQRGFGLPSAIFLILIMALFIAGIHQLNEINASVYGREWMSMRAFYAAESGAQTAAVYALTSEPEGTCDNAYIANLNLNSDGLKDCTINVACLNRVVDSSNHLTLTSTASCGNGPDQAVRVVQIRVVP